MTNRTKYLNKVMEDYIISNIDSENYGVICKGTDDKLAFLARTFINEYGWSISRYGVVMAFREWLMGLPSAISIDFENYKILQLSVKWGSLPVNHTDKQADKILGMWFNFVTVHTFKLFKKYKIEVQ